MTAGVFRTPFTSKIEEGSRYLSWKKWSGGSRHASIVWLDQDQEDRPVLVCWLQHVSVQEFWDYRRKEKIRSKQQNFGQQCVKNQEVYWLTIGWEKLNRERSWTSDWCSLSQRGFCRSFILTPDRHQRGSFKNQSISSNFL